MNAFDADTVKLQGLNLIEASAGTGKTYTLAELYLRLILEEGISGEALTVDQVLVVTFTKAAKEELRDRLRQKLVDARGDLSKDPADRENLKQLTDPDQIQQTSQKLTVAIQSFDEAAIFTIHGFCQRVLGDFAFESGQRFDVEFIGDQQILLQSITDDFWRREVTTADKNTVAYLLAKKEAPESLLKSVQSLLGKPYLDYLPIPAINIEQCEQSAQAQFERVKLVRQSEHEAIVATLQNKTLLKGNKYRTTSVEKWLLSLTELLTHADLPMKLFADFDRFTPVKLEDALKAKKTLPKLDFWSVCELFLEQYQQLQQAREIQRQQLRLQLLQILGDTLPQQKQQQKVMSYDDLLLNLQQALAGEQGDYLVARLRKQYQAALIDEFQDTDPVQYGIFSRIYSDSGLPTFLVGDPKQAIYSFRGADIFTYLEAKSRAEHEHTLTSNWRSHPDLVSAVNTIFSRQSEPFIYQDIPFHKVAAERKDKPTLIIEQGQSAPLQILWSDSGEELATKGTLTTITANVTADKIADLLNQAQSGRATLYDEDLKQYRAVTGGDIAVLVRSHKQAREIQQCLQKRGVNSVQQGRDNVFSSDEALLLQRALLAIAEPNNESRIRTALVSRLWGLNATELHALQENEQQWHHYLDVFFELHQLWLKHGFMRMFRQLLVEVSAQQRLLSLPGGDRQLTNLHHLAELTQDFCSHQNEGVEAVLNWLATHIQSADVNDETAQLRLESDEQLVKIITIHKSKGLEYPIVFCPFMWSANLRSAKEDVITFHQTEHDNRACVAFSEPALSQAAELVTTEERAEDLRLLYVALTRARERCIIVWGAVNSVNDTALFSLFHPESQDINSEQMLLDVQALADSNKGTISLDILADDMTDVILYQPSAESLQTLTAKEFTGTIQPPWRIGSFSALTRGHDAELPDYDQDVSFAASSLSSPLVESPSSSPFVASSLSSPLVESPSSSPFVASSLSSSLVEDPSSSPFVVSSSNHEPASILRQGSPEQSRRAQNGRTMDRFSFPRGAQAGTCLHALFEYWDFASTDNDAMQKLVSRTLLQYGFDDKWTKVACQWLTEVLATRLDTSNFVLADLTLDKRLDELAFYFPVANLTVTGLQQTLLPLLAENAPLAIVLKRLKFAHLTGFMKGFIDLVYEYQGKFYIVDYKSNHLGNNEQDYQSVQLDDAMVAHDYPLQYLIYSLALHRYLKVRLPDYDPKQHLGGVYYLFIRGMKAEWGQAGVFYDKIDIELLETLDQYIQGEFLDD